jgi:hypothetical protein
MSPRPPANALRWAGDPGHYEVYYLSLTDAASGVGLWIRYTMVAPVEGSGEEATCSLWFMAMDREGTRIGRKISHPAERLRAQTDPFELTIADATLTDRGAAGGFDDVSWELTWTPGLPAYEHVHPLLEKAKIAKTVYLLPHADLAIDGTVEFDGRRLDLSGARGGQAHLWGSKHAARWAWLHCNDLRTADGAPVPGEFVDGVSVYVPRFGREIGPSTPLVGRIDDRDLLATSPRAIRSTKSLFTLTSWSFDARVGSRRIDGEVSVPRDALVGVTYHDPDGDLAYCYNSEVADLRLLLWERDRSAAGGWRLDRTLLSNAGAHFEYAQRDPVPGLPLLVR